MDKKIKVLFGILCLLSLEACSTRVISTDKTSIASINNAPAGNAYGYGAFSVDLAFAAGQEVSLFTGALPFNQSQVRSATIQGAIPGVHVAANEYELQNQGCFPGTNGQITVTFLMDDPTQINTVLYNIRCNSDFNSDGTVDLVDFRFLQQCFNQLNPQGPCQRADLNFDFRIDSIDYVIWRTAYGHYFPNP